MKEVYAFKNNDKEIMESSSGGAFIAICNSFEKCYGKNKVAFYGVTIDDELNIIHKRVESAEKCHIFKGSKYVKSEHIKIFENIELDIKNKKHILFSGTPCQIISVKKYLEIKQIKYENILFVDIICHGTPQKKFWNEYKQWLEKKVGSKLVKYTFRYKPEGWKAYPAYAEFKNGKKLINSSLTSIYSKLHMLGYITNKACFSCPYAKEDRVSDITIGDYWGIEKIEPDFPSKKGVSLVIVNSEKAKKIIKRLVADNTNSILKRTKTNSYLNYQHNLNKPTKKPENYETFINDYESKGFEYIIKKYIKYGMKYRIMHNLKKFLRKTPLIELYRKIKNR